MLRAGLTRSPMERDLVSLDVTVEPVLDLTSTSVRRRLKVLKVKLDTLRGDDAEELEACLELADYARAEGYTAILTPSAASKDDINLAIYVDGRADRMQLDNSTRAPTGSDCPGNRSRLFKAPVLDKPLNTPPPAKTIASSAGRSTPTGDRRGGFLQSGTRGEPGGPTNRRRRRRGRSSESRHRAQRCG